MNCAQGTKLNQINTDKTYFDEAGIKFHGIRALDIFTFKMTPHFQPAAVFIDDALNNGGNINSVMGSEEFRGRGQSTLIVNNLRPLSAHRRNAIQMVVCWRADSARFDLLIRAHQSYAKMCFFLKKSMK